MIIKNGNVILGDKIIKTDIKVENGIISYIGEADGEGVLAVEGMYVSPGFVDIHTHGGFGGDFMDASDDSFDKALTFHSQNGTTSTLTSSATAPPAHITSIGSEKLPNILEYEFSFIKKVFDRTIDWYKDIDEDVIVVYK